MSTNATEGGQGQESGTPNGTQSQGQESGQGAGQGQESGQQGSQSAAQQGQQGNTAEQFDLSTIQDPALRSYLETQQRQAREAREEAARYRTERNQFQQQAQTLQQQNETDAERQQREAQERQERLETLEKENRTLKVGSAIQSAAEKAKAFNPALIVSMLDSRVTLDDKGEPTNLQDLLTSLRQSDPYLFKRANQDGGEGTGQQQGQPAGSMNDLIRGQVAARRGRTTS
ncbi:MAG: phage scaffolding protein [Paracoccus sp. (in: a-proteobacteria)]